MNYYPVLYGDGMRYFNSWFHTQTCYRNEKRYHRFSRAIGCMNLTPLHVCLKPKPSWHIMTLPSVNVTIVKNVQFFAKQQLTIENNKCFSNHILKKFICQSPLTECNCFRVGADAEGLIIWLMCMVTVGKYTMIYHTWMQWVTFYFPGCSY